MLDLKAFYHLAQLAKIKIENEEAKEMLQALNQKIAWVNTLQKIDTTYTKPLAILSFEKNNLKEDHIQPSLPHQRVFQNAPTKDQHYFKVPDVKS